MTLRTTLATLLLAATAALAVACKAEPIPAPDPQGKDIVAGAILAAVTSSEATPGVRIYKVLHVDDYPQPIGWNLHLAAYDPKAASFEEARDLRHRGGMSVVNPHFEVRVVDFIGRDHRIVGVEPLSEAELAPYIKARDHK